MFNKRLLLSISLIFTGILMPSMIKIGHLDILELISETAYKTDGGILLLAASRLVLLNTIRAVPHYLGVFIMGEEIKEYYEKPYILIFLISISIIPAVYYIIDKIYNIKYDFGGPALLSTIIILVIFISTQEIKNFFAKSIIITLFLFAFQWLDVMPALTPYYFGRGELSSVIKSLGIVINADHILNFFGFIFWLVLITSALIISRLFIGNYRRIEIIEEKRERERQVNKMKFKMIEQRADKEMRYLVHDLKTPLTTIQGLNDVIGLQIDNEQIKKHTKIIDNAVKSMNQIITEMRNKNVRSIIEVGELVNMVKKQLSGEYFPGKVNIINKTQVEIKTNKIRLTRAVINLVDNSFEAIRKKFKNNPENGLVELIFFKNKDYLVIKISDNGTGLEQDQIVKIKDLSFEEKNLNKSGAIIGVGIEFVKRVVKEHNGFIKVNSEIGKGTEIEILIPCYNERGGNK